MPALIRASYALGTYEPRIVRALSRHIASGMIVYDVGAHVGYLSLLMAKLVGATGRVFAFEADPTNRAALEQNIARNRVSNVTVVPKAVTATTGSVVFATFPYSFVSHIATTHTPDDAQLISTPAVSLDDFVFRDGNPPPAVLKIDVEGAEADVIRGMARVLRERRPAIIAEVRGGIIWHEIRDALRSLDYRAYALHASSQNDLAQHGVTDVLLVADPAT